MTIKHTLVANRICISFVLILILLASCIPLAFFNIVFWSIVPATISLLLIIWLVYSSNAKAKLISDGAISKDQKDAIEEITNVIMPKNKLLLRILAAYGLSIGISIVLVSFFVVFKIDILVNYATPASLTLGFVVVFAISYIAVRNRVR